ncbi:MAG: ComF family protein [Ignavibacteria bacterium]
MGLNLTVKNFAFDLLDFFLPNFCIICNQKIHRTFYSICNNCINELEISNNIDLHEFYNHNLSRTNLITHYYAKYEFIKDGKFQTAVHNLKYNHKSRIGIQLGIELGKELLKQSWFDEIDIIIPVPIHRIKKLSRGYNQSDFIAKGISIITQKSLDTKSLKRIRNTPTQTHLHLQERIENVKNAFKVVKKQRIRKKVILIVDDVCTTGSTVNEIAKTLLNAGAKKVNLATLAFVKERDFSLKV